MSSILCINAAKKTQEDLKKEGVSSELRTIQNNEYLAKLILTNKKGSIDIYSNSKGKITILTRNITDNSLKDHINNLLKNIEDRRTIKPTGVITAYTDGSGERGECGWSCVLFSPEGIKKEEKYGNLGTQPNNQIAGEVEGAVEAIIEAIKLKRDIIIRHDYEGVGKWGRNEWKGKDTDAQRLKEWVKYATTQKISINFEWTRGHNGDYGNERADALASKGTQLSPTVKKYPPSIKNIQEI